MDHLKRARDLDPSNHEYLEDLEQVYEMMFLQPPIRHNQGGILNSIQ
jgi:hypothetical protein